MPSLQMGQTRRELAAAAPTGEALASRATLEAMSSVSVVEVCELSETELSEGVSCCGRCGMTAGERVRPLPKTRPPPRDLRDAIRESRYRHEADSRTVFCLY